MAKYRPPEYCFKCGKLLTPIYKDQSEIPLMQRLIGDTFIGYKPCECSKPIKTEGEDEREIHANDTFFYLPTMAAFICVGRDEGKVWYVPDGEMESKWFDKSDCQLIVAPSCHHLSNRITDRPGKDETIKHQDEIIGRLTRENGWLKDTEQKRQEWLRDAKKEAGFHDNISFDDVWKAVLSAYKKAPPPSPVGIDVDALAKTFLIPKYFTSIPSIEEELKDFNQLIDVFKAGYSASLPSSSVTGEEVRRNIVSEIKSAICDDEKSEADIAYSICIRIINKHFESLPVTGESEAGERKFTLKEALDIYYDGLL